MKPGDHFISCDGKSIDELMKERSEFDKLLINALEQKDRELALKQVNGVWFVRLPTLALSGEANVKRIRSLVATK